MTPEQTKQIEEHNEKSNEITALRAANKGQAEEIDQLEKELDRCKAYSGCIG